MNQQLRSTAREASNHPVIEKGARLGFAISGLLHLLIAWIALQVAWGGGGGQEADQSGALTMLAGTPAGPVLLWAAVGGFALLALWHLTETVVGSVHSTWYERIAAGGKAIAYAVLAWTALRVSQRASQSGEESAQSFTGELLGTLAGQILVALIGLGIIGVGLFQIFQGWTERFAKYLESDPGRFVIVAGRVGYIARGVAFAVIGMLFVSAAVSDRAGEAGGLDGALRTLRDQPFGPYLLTLVALGIAAFGVFCFGRAKHAKL